MEQISVGELVKRAKGDDRSLREYARDSGVDAAIISKIINGTYTPKKPGIYESLTSPQASPRAGVTYRPSCAWVIRSSRHLTFTSISKSFFTMLNLTSVKDN